MRPFLAILALLLVVLAVVAAFVAGYTLRGASSTGGTTTATSLEALVIADLEAHYYKPVDPARLDQAGVVATLKSLHDPYTVYMTAQQSQALVQALSGHYSGIGAAFHKSGKALVVTQVFAGSPAKAGRHRSRGLDRVGRRRRGRRRDGRRVGRPHQGRGRHAGHSRRARRRQGQRPLGHAHAAPHRHARDRDEAPAPRRQVDRLHLPAELRHRRRGERAPRRGAPAGRGRPGVRARSA